MSQRQWKNPEPLGVCMMDQFVERQAKFANKVRRVIERCEHLALDNDEDREELIDLLTRKLGPQ